MEYQNKGFDDHHHHHHSLLYLPPGFRFHPTDEEIITSYLKEKVLNHSFTSSAIGDADFNKCEPWDLPKKAKMEDEKEWYFFCQRDRKYPTGTRTNRATQSGYWKATGKDKEICKKSSGKTSTSYLVGMKKTLVFYTGRAPKGEKSNWVMHEYRLDGHFSYHNLPMKDEWVVSRVFHKSTGLMKKMSSSPSTMNITDQKNENQLLFDYHSTLPPLVEVPQQASSFVDYYQDQFKTNNSTSSNTMFNPQFSFKNNDPNSFPYLFQQNSTPHFQRQSKIDQYSSNRNTMADSHASQDTGLTTDAHTEISSSLNIVDDHGPLLATMPDFSSLLWDDY